MIKIEKLNKEDFWKCSSCLKSTDEIDDMYEIIIGKNLNQQFSTVRLCYSCLGDLKCKINLLDKNTNKRTV